MEGDPILGNQMFNLMTELFPICRSITGDGVRKTLKIIQRELPDLKIFEIPSGTKAFDWTVPKEWNIHDAYVIDPKGKKIIDFQKSNLHVVGYSVPVDKEVSFDELQNHLFSLPDQPDAIPYITSYYKEMWGFCLTHNQRKLLRPGNYKVCIDSTLTNGSLTYGELKFEGKSDKEIFLSTYICHPSMANNELSGPVVTTYLAKWIREQKERNYSYRIIFIPETIGSIVYLSQNFEIMKNRIIAGFNVTCVGDDRNYSFLASRYGRSKADQVAQHVLKNMHPDFLSYSFMDRGSDERQFCSPGIDLPVVSIMRSKYGEYPEYHTSLDNLDFVSPGGLYGSYEVLQLCIACIEHNETLKVNVLCEPQLSKRGLYPTISTKESQAIVKDMMNLITYCDGTNDLITVADLINVPLWTLFNIVDKLKVEGLLINTK
jgi:aminopeptidase-like protein